MGEGLGSTAGGLTSKSSKSDSSNNNATHETNTHRDTHETRAAEMRSACGGKRTSVCLELLINHLSPKRDASSSGNERFLLSCTTPAVACGSCQHGVFSRQTLHALGGTKVGFMFRKREYAPCCALRSQPCCGKYFSRLGTLLFLKRVKCVSGFHVRADYLSFPCRMPL